MTLAQACSRKTSFCAKRARCAKRGEGRTTRNKSLTRGWGFVTGLGAIPPPRAARKPSPLVGEGGAIAPGEGDKGIALATTRISARSFCSEVSARGASFPPHPALRATFSRRGEGKGVAPHSPQEEPKPPPPYSLTPVSQTAIAPQSRDQARHKAQSLHWLP